MRQATVDKNLVLRPRIERRALLLVGSVRPLEVEVAENGVVTKEGFRLRHIWSDLLRWQFEAEQVDNLVCMKVHSEEKVKGWILMIELLLREKIMMLSGIDFALISTSPLEKKSIVWIFSSSLSSN